MDFRVEELLDQPLVAHLATSGPTLRPIWFLWEDQAFWWLTGTWSHLPGRLTDDPRVGMVVDTCDLATGVVRQVRARGEAELHAYDPDRAYRKLRRYLGDDPEAWDRERFSLEAEEGDRFACLRPARLEAIDLSYRPASR